MPERLVDREKRQVEQFISIARPEGGPRTLRGKPGFGIELIEREVQGTLHGSASFKYAGTGLTATILFPLK